MSNIDSVWFHTKLEERKASLRDMARFMALDPGAVSRMLNGKRKMSAEEQDQIAEYFGVPLEEVAARRRGKAGGFAETKQAQYAHQGERRQKATVSSSDNRKAGDIHPIFGCMEGTMTIPDDLDLTAPIDAEWSDKLYNE